ncbi:pancreatic secretory granule membrane major glycoprotein GP2-like [Ambystoma mexicanum]|uniref:pancreatic secretory granule membrane major glycoprotein GP2-like n=1 Tax=Ambystoma mexicanum TaxID=8296 RepID=UPI0037E941F6
MELSVLTLWLLLLPMGWASDVLPTGIPPEHDHVHEYSTIPPRTGGQLAPTPTRPGCGPLHHCQNGGVCEQGNCTCKSGFRGSRCQDMKMLLSCDENQMTVSVIKDVFGFYGTPTSALHLNSADCKLSEVTVHGEIYVSAKLTYVNRTVCGTQIQVNGSHLIYSNQIQATLPAPTSIVVRTSNVSINFSCIYVYEKMAALPYSISAQQMRATFIVKEGLYVVTMALYQTNEFLAPLVGLPSPIPLQDHLHVQLQLERPGLQALFVLTVNNCWATPTMNYSHAAKYTFISRGCQNDPTMTFNDTRGSLVRFSIQMFRFINYPQFYLHCQVRLCAPNETHSCLKNCWNGTDWTPYRRRRSADDDDDDDDRSLYMRIVSIGPIQQAEQVLQARKPPDSGLGQLLVPGVLAVACVAGLFFLVAVSKALKKHSGLGLSSRKRCNKL